MDEGEVLAERQLTMGALSDWLPVAVERASEASWVTEQAPGHRQRYRVRVQRTERGVAVEETLRAEPSR